MLRAFEIMQGCARGLEVLVNRERVVLLRNQRKHDVIWAGNGNGDGSVQRGFHTHEKSPLNGGMNSVEMIPNQPAGPSDRRASVDVTIHSQKDDGLRPDRLASASASASPPPVMSIQVGVDHLQEVGEPLTSDLNPSPGPYSDEIARECLDTGVGARGLKVEVVARFRETGNTEKHGETRELFWLLPDIKETVHCVEAAYPGFKFTRSRLQNSERLNNLFTRDFVVPFDGPAQAALVLWTSDHHCVNKVHEDPRGSSCFVPISHLHGATSYDKVYDSGSHTGISDSVHPSVVLAVKIRE
ncbi:hypothetical protein EI94DRAFT_1706147 [Lactarius quietus]|nr:hypothetical protein EI94DRAFT_1706147 [Lactarius quietus]